MIRKLLLPLILLFFTVDLSATHYAGGYITYECVGNNDYKFKIVRYRDLTGVSFSPSIPLNINAVDGSENFSVTASVVSKEVLPIPKTSPCHLPPEQNSIQIERWIYEIPIVTLTGGSAYDLFIDPDCCRNGEIINIYNPGGTGSILYTRMPDPTKDSCNVAPEFDTIPPLEFCLDRSLTIDHSATDADGDSLVYYFCEALQGASPYNPPALPPLPSVTYSSGFSANYPVQSNPALTIDQAGIITGKPIQEGAYTIKVCVEEYRNGTMIGYYGREFQIVVVNCSRSASIETDAGDSIISCNRTISFESDESGINDFWQFDYPNGSDTSNIPSPSFTYPDTGTYTVMHIVEPGLECADTAFATVVIKDSLDHGLDFMDASSDETVCQGDSVELTAIGADSYSWSPTESLSCSACESPEATPQKSEIYTVVGTWHGCTQEAYVKVEVDTPVTGTIKQDTSICAGDTIQLTSSGYVSYDWNNEQYLNNDTLASPLAWPFKSTTFKLSSIDSLGCQHTDTVKVTVKSINTSIMFPDDSIEACAGDTMEWHVDPTPFVRIEMLEVYINENIVFQDTGKKFSVVYNLGDTLLGVVYYVESGCSGYAETNLVIDDKAEIHGTIRNSTLNPLPSTWVYLIKYNPNDSTLSAIDSIQTDGNGEYSFETSEPEVYVKAVPDSATYPNEMPTYYDSSLTWSNATKVTLQDCDSVEASFSTIAGNNPGGPGFISGKVSEGAGKNLWSGDAIPNLTLFLINEQGQPVTYAITDKDGWFEMKNLPTGEFTLIGDRPFLKNEEAPTIEITAAEPRQDSLIVKVVENKLEITKTSTGIKLPQKGHLEVRIYPNPASGYVTVQMERFEEADYLIEVTDLSGKVLQTKTSISDKVNLSTEQLTDGIYFLKVESDQGYVVRKLIITK